MRFPGAGVGRLEDESRRARFTLMMRCGFGEDRRDQVVGQRMGLGRAKLEGQISRRLGRDRRRGSGSARAGPEILMTWPQTEQRPRFPCDRSSTLNRLPHCSQVKVIDIPTSVVVDSEPPALKGRDDRRW